MENEAKTNWRSIDHRIDGLRLIIDGLTKAIKVSADRMELNGWYDAIWFREDTEPIYGLAFIAFQNYINGSIKDRYNTLSIKHQVYQSATIIPTFDRSFIELVIALANYIKHKEEAPLHKGTREILIAFRLNVSDDVDITESPIFEGIDLLSSKWCLSEIMTMIESWRKSLWQANEITNN